MKKSLYSKLMLIMLVVIISLMAVVGAFLMRGVRNFYLTSFYKQMQSVFSSTGIAADLRDAAEGDEPAARMAVIVRAYSGPLASTPATAISIFSPATPALSSPAATHRKTASP